MYNNTQTYVASAARTVSGNSGAPATIDYSHEGTFALNVSAASGTLPTLVVTVEGHDPLSNTYYPILTTASLIAPGLTILRVSPSIPPVANLTAQDMLPRFVRFSWTIGGTTPSFTFTIGAIN